MEEKILKEDEAVKIIQKYGSIGKGERGKPMIFGGNRHEIDMYLEAVDLIVKLMGPAANSSDTEKKRLEGIMQTARNQLENEFERISIIKHRMLSSCINHGNTHSTSYTSSISCGSFLTKNAPEYHIPDQDALLLIAQRLRSMQYLHAIVQLYKMVRNSFLLAFLRVVDIMRPSAVDIQKMEWESLEKKIESWIKASQKFLNHIQKEREMFQAIFEDLGAESNEAHLLDMFKHPATIFFGFADVVSTAHHSPQRLFKILDLWHNMLLILPMVQDAFRGKALESIRILPGKIVSQLGVAAKEMLLKFENSVQSDLTHITSIKETIHPLTQYVIWYMIRMITEHKNLLMGLILSDPPTTQTRAANGSPLASHLVFILDVLTCNLKSKCREQEDAFGHLFMMNNVNYMTESIIKCSELREMVGSDYLDYLEEIVQSERDGYMSSTWNDIEQLLSKGLAIKKCSFQQKLIKMCSIGSTRPVALSRRGTLRHFNELFEQIHGNQSKWLVPNMAVRLKLRESIQTKVIKMYQVFLEELFKNPCRNQKKLKRCIKYSVDELGNAISQLFEGRPAVSLQSKQTQGRKPSIMS